MTDGWKGCNSAKNYYEHYTANYSENYSDPITDATNAIEAIWNGIKHLFSTQ